MGYLSINTSVTCGFVETCRGLIETQKELKVKTLRGGWFVLFFLSDDKALQLSNKRNILSIHKNFIDKDSERDLESHGKLPFERVSILTANHNKSIKRVIVLSLDT